ncbi:transferase [Mycobacterium gordonae]|uniref:Transferase n=1 Tax=Mycobacterium gordonae TaxID=1778 RepID=A0A0Q2LWC4_MYCGO|nr:MULTISPECIES: methyltransferase domain-containing protein [Mycobacterium]KQH80209.1 transferase [Mycobacterium gordonae]MDP7732497.1 methyltransferase domain-containing protein [Mycobacterium sp. TY813]
MSRCRGCGDTDLTRVLDLGKAPAAEQFPLRSEPLTPAETMHALAMDLCGCCGLAQLAGDDAFQAAEEQQSVEPQAMLDQAADAVQRVAAGGWLRGSTVREFGSPHGGTWLPMFTDRGYREAEIADVVLDTFGLMHDPDQRAAFELRAKATALDGVLLVQIPSLMAMVSQGQWNLLRHSHFGYHSLTALTNLLGSVGMSIATVWEFDLLGGTYLAAAVHGRVARDERADEILKLERQFGVTKPYVLRRMQKAVDVHVEQLRQWLEAQADQQISVYAYCAGSRVPGLFSVAGIDQRLIKGIADASPDKHGRRVPGTDIEIISPEQLIAADPDRVLLTLPYLYDEVRRTYPQLDGRWWVDHGTSVAEGQA